MLYGKYSFHCVMTDDAVLPMFTGSTFRGAFGHALKGVVCALKREDCPTCLLRGRCVYFTVFETPRDSAERPGPSPPHPFVIEPPVGKNARFRCGDTFSLGLLLFGEARNSLPYFVYTVKRMGERGIGRRVDGQRPGFSIDTISSGTEVLYRADSGHLSSGSSTYLKAPDVRHGQQDCRRLTVTLETPLRLKHDSRLQRDLPFHVLIRASLRRIADLNNHWGDGEPALDYSGLVRRAGDIHTVRSDLEWIEFKRYSNRQRRTVSMGGVLGRVSYVGELGEFLPILRYCELVHMGKATTFGFGKVRIG